MSLHVERGIPERSAGALGSVYVYEAPVRLWHWLNVLCMLVLAITGYLIGRPLWPSLAGEASHHFLMGYIRFMHFAAGYIFAVGLLGRIYWAFAGNRHARQIFYLPLFNKRWWLEVWFQWRWYMFRVQAPKQYLGHDPLAQLVMVLLFTVPAVFMVLTGFALYGEGTGLESWQARLTGWVIPLLGQSQGVHTWHRLGMWVLVFFTIVHVYAAIREDIVAGRSIMNAMITGYRSFKD